MPIRPENRARYAQHVSEILNAAELEAIDELRASLHFDTLTQPLFWESWVARQFDGETTAHSSQHDIEVVARGKRYAAEVKYSRAFACAFGNGVRRVFKWARPRGFAGKSSAQACILLGLDIDDFLHAWVIPTLAIPAKCSSITMTCPSQRHNADHARAIWDRYSIPTDQLLPEFLRVCRGDYDKEHHAETMRATRRARLAISDMFAMTGE